MEIFFIIGRIFFGGFFLINGINHLTKTTDLASYSKSKGLTTPKIAVIVSGLFLILGGTGIILWMFHGIALMLIIVFLALASFKIHNYWKETDPNKKMIEKIQFMKNMALLGSSMILFSL